MKTLARFTLALLVFAAFLPACFLSAQKGLQKALDAKRTHNPVFFENDAVVGTGISVDAEGNAVIKVYTKDNRLMALPDSVDGVKIVRGVSGVIRAGNPNEQDRRDAGKRAFGKGNGKGGGGGGGGGGSTDPRDRHPRPVPIGVSIGTYRPNNLNYCFAGTLGCRLVRVDMVNNTESRFILSNNHVIAEQNAGTIGEDKVIQPGTLDNGCVLDLNDIIGELADFEPIKFNGQSNLVDAAIASTTSSETGFASPSDAYGAPSANTVQATPGMSVQKFGRTTGLTRGTVDAINVTVNVQYDGGVARFDGQIFIVGGRGKNRVFSDSGDSGSLIVTRDGNRPTGLLFAGSSTVTVANPIDAVLDTFSNPGQGIFFYVDDGN